MYLVNILKGFLYGIFSVAPGLSGGVLANYFGDYKKCIVILNKFRFRFSEISYLTSIFLGFFIGIISSSRIILYCYDNFFELFKWIVLIINIVLFLKLLTQNRLRFNINNRFICLLLFAALVLIILKIYKPVDGLFMYAITGIVYSTSKIIPGISSTSILIYLNFYDNLMLFLSNPISEFMMQPLLWSLFLVSFIIFSIFLFKLVYKMVCNSYFDDLMILIMFYNIVLLLM